MKRLSAEDNELYQRTSEVLHYVWDPIGVHDEPRARDEYDSYLPQVFQLMKANSSPQAIAHYLEKIEVERMGLGKGEPSDRLLRVAEMLLDWKKLIDEKQAA